MKVKSSLNGILVVDKPKGLTSTETLEKVRKILRVKKAGHGGTLDPIATGVLPIFLNNATKLAEIFLEGDKVYEGEFQLGITTETYDITGEIVAKKDVPEIDINKIQEVANSFLGEIEQVPP
ncbi:MAG: tRNA pseudouridine(55) synthase TruB, partial [Thermodesulfobacterium sp.]|nr:tRNA pseudouridine(55) synthase TruB [Thermodesulfobacterium sp.]